MSITLDVSHFLQNELSGLLDGTTTSTTSNHHQQATSKMEAMLHKELECIAEPKDDAASIFDEIENYLKLNKLIDNNGNLGMPEQAQNLHEQHTKTKQPSLPPPQPITISSPELEFQEFTLPHCVPSHFLLPDEGHNFQEFDPQLFSLEDGQLLPISSPFMVPGIYKKLSNTLNANSLKLATTKPNVFITAYEERGCVVSAGRFHELYICGDANGEPPEEYVRSKQRPVLLLEALETQESDEEDDVAKPMPALGFYDGTRVPKQWDALSRLAYDLLKLSNRDPIVIDRKRNEIVRTNNATSQRTIYRFLSPENVGLKPNQNHIVSLPAPKKSEAKTSVLTHSRLGRPRKRAAEQTDNQPQVKKKAQKKRKSLPKPVDSATILQEPVKHPPIDTEPNMLRTRFGRIVRNRLTPSKSEPATDDADVSVAVEDSVDFIQSFLSDLKDSDYRCSRPISPLDVPVPISLPQPEVIVAAPSDSLDRGSKFLSPSQRKVPPESVCPTCNKIFLGRRMQRHYVQHPDHMQVPIIDQITATQPPPPSPIVCQQPLTQPSDDMSLFRFLVSKLQRTHLSEDQRADLFLNEINDLVTQLQLRSSRLIRNTSGLHFVSARCSRVLGIPEGHYALDMMAIENEAPPPPPIEPAESSVQPCILNFEHLSSSALPAPSTTARNLDYTALSMSLDDTLTDEAAQKLNLSAGGKLLPPSEESLLRTVGDLVHDGMQKLQQQSAAAENLLHTPANMGSVPLAKSTLVPPGIHYDHASDNAVEAVNMKETIAVQQTAPMLGLSVDFFQFNND